MNDALTFALGGEVIAVPIQAVKEIIQSSALTLVPLMPDTIRGVINLRWAVVPVVDLSVRLGRGSTLIHRRTCTVILELCQDEKVTVLGMLVDQVREVLDIGLDELEPAPTFGSKLPPDYLRNVGKVDGKFVLILNVDRVLSVAELAL